jgi:type III pantothenate kinase
VKLLLDVGNSRIKWAWLDEQGALSCGAPGLHAQESAAAIIERVAAGGVSPDQVVVSHVGSAVLRDSLQTAITARWPGVEVHWLRARAQACGVRCAYADPARLGADRWAALIGARSRWPGAVAILDFGTAITLDGLAADGAHMGGLIAPGYHLMVQALHGNTGALAAAGEINHGQPPGLFAADTAGAINSGIYHSIQGLVMEVMRALGGSMPDGYTLVVTGGGLAHVRSCLPADVVVAPDLVLQGLARVAREDT